MAQKSKRAKYHAQTKRELALAKRYASLCEQERVKSVSLLLMLLAKQGGDVTLEKDFLDSVKGQIGFMGYQYDITPAGHLHVKVVLKEEAMAEAMAAVAEAAQNTPPVDPAVPAIVLTD